MPVWSILALRAMVALLPVDPEAMLEARERVNPGATCTRRGNASGYGWSALSIEVPRYEWEGVGDREI